MRTRIALLTLLALAPAAPGQDLPARGEERFDPEVLALRVDERWAGRLLGVALDPDRPAAERERALRLLGAIADDLPTAETLSDMQQDERLGTHVMMARARIGARRRAFELARLVDDAALAAREAVAAGAARAVEPFVVRELCALARDPLHARAGAAARVVGLLAPEDEALDAVLVAVARTGRRDARPAAIEALAGRGRPLAVAEAVAGALLCAAERGDDERAAEDLVAHVRGDEAAQAFCRRAFAAEVPEAARVLAARGAGRAGLHTAATWLRGQLRGAGPALHAAALTGLARLDTTDPELPAALLEVALAGGREAYDAAEALARVAADRREPLLRAALDDAEPERRLRALELIYALGDPALAPRLAELVRSPDAPWAARHLAVLGLGRIGGAGAHAALAWALDPRERGPEATVLRRAAAAALGQCAPEPAARAGRDAEAARAGLEAALRVDDDEPLRRAALEALGAWGDPRSRAALAAALARPARSTAERLARARACERLGLVDARVLALAAEDADAELGLAVISCARAADDPTAVPALLGLLEHRARGVRRAAGTELHRRRGTRREWDEGASLHSAQHREAVRGWREWWERSRPR